MQRFLTLAVLRWWTSAPRILQLARDSVLGMGQLAYPEGYFPPTVRDLFDFLQFGGFLVVSHSALNQTRLTFLKPDYAGQMCVFL